MHSEGNNTPTKN